MPKFTPIKPFEMYEPGTNFGNPSKNSAFISNIVADQINMSGVCVNVFRMLGTFDQDRDALGIKHDEHGTKLSALDIGSFIGLQDPVLNENRDRKYDFDSIPVLKGVYKVSANELEYLKFGMALSNDVITMEFHTKTLEEIMGRRFIVGDVVELEHLREVGINGKSGNKWYEVSSVTWSPNGYDAQYNRHILAIILKPVRNQQEFLDILENVTDQYGKNILEQLGNKQSLEAINIANQSMADEQAHITMYDTHVMYFDPDKRNVNPWFQSGKPPNGEPVQYGAGFPGNPQDGDWFLRVDLIPNKLYRFEGGVWRMRQVDNKREWQQYNYINELREHLSDRSEKDKARKWKLRSIHDVITDREERSDPTCSDSDVKEP